MNKIKIKKIFFFILLFTIGIFINNKVFAAELYLSNSKTIVGIGEEFYVDLMINTEGESINTIDGSISFSNKNISFIRAEEGKSIVKLWVLKPEINNRTISFAGIIPNGFDGIIDPFNPNIKLDGIIMRFIFVANETGSVEFNSSIFSLNINDGLGTELKIQPFSNSINIGNYKYKYIYKTSNNENPELDAYISRDKNIYNNKYFIIFNAFDKKTGIDNVMIKEGRRKWKKVESPYLLLDQSRHSRISIQATNYSGSSKIVNIDPISYSFYDLVKVLLKISVILFIIYYIRKYVYKK